MKTQFQRNSDRLSKWLNGLTEPLKLLIAVPAVMTTLTAQIMPLLFGYAITTFSDRINSTAIGYLTKLICSKVPILCRANGSCLFITGRKPLHIFNHSKLMHNLFLDFEPDANSVTKSLVLLALYSTVKQCYTVFADCILITLF